MAVKQSNKGLLRHEQKKNEWMIKTFKNMSVLNVNSSSLLGDLKPNKCKNQTNVKYQDSQYFPC